MADKLTDAVGVLTVNPGSTSTKISVFSGADERLAETLPAVWQTDSEYHGFQSRVDALVKEILRFLGENNISGIDAVVGRGGFVDRTNGPVSGGIYEVAYLDQDKVCLREDIIRAVSENPEMVHPSNFGIPVAAQLAVELGIPAFCVDPVVSDDFSVEARYSGYKPVERKSTAHALSVRMLAKLTAHELAKPVDDTRMVAIHMGGGITVAALRHGLMVDNNIALLGSGPFTPQRVGGLPMSALIDLCYNSGMSKQELSLELTKRGGLVSYLQDDNMVRISKRIEEGDAEAAEVVNAMTYQIAKEVGAMAIAAGPPLDAIVISGGLARSNYVVDSLKSRVEHLAPVYIFPGSVEMLAMARGAMDVLAGKEIAIVYYLPAKH